MRRIQVGHLHIGAEAKKAVNEVLSSGRVSEGAKTFEFEQQWAKYIGTRYAVAVNSGTSALIAGLWALKYLYKLPRGAKVLTSPLTFIATVNAVTFSGFQPVFADIDPRTFVITPESIEKALKREKNVAAIIPVHLMGYPADMAAINAIARKYGIVVMEDAAQAHGSTYHGKKAGSLAELGIFSFYIAHNIQAGEMGAVTTDNPKIYALLKKIKAHGRMCDCRVCTRDKGICPHLAHLRDNSEDIDPRFYHDILGLNFKTMEFTSALALTQLAVVDSIFAKRSENVRYLNEALKPLSQFLQLPVYSKNISYLAYPLVLKENIGRSRKEVRDALACAGIETRPLFGCIPLQQPVYGHLKKKYAHILPHAEYVGRNGFYLGCHQYLTAADLRYIVKTLRGIFTKG